MENGNHYLKNQKLKNTKENNGKKLIFKIQLKIAFNGLKIR